ncbi:hypothetical protein SY83_03685 [Paenibacillus swuensis]|uniref:DEAD/DEAH box helicase n=1 Tax=Paenibacillus swuensis TaxID=1178515 RepID=A0A172TPG7_9BACL|nr:hypothetical protein SY83_03685 [Paenibacillus swuensis]
MRPELVEALKSSGVSEPTPVQSQSIPLLLKDRDLIAQAQTGTGKTLAFVLPMLEKINTKSSHVQGLIITPTRELALQITNELKKLAPVVGAKVLAAYGGQDVERQVHRLKGDIHIVVGTPGRLLDHLRRGTVEFGHLRMLVLDEADQMLHMGFLAEVEEIISQSSGRRQTMLFSATMPAQIRHLASSYLKHPEEVRVAGRKVTLDEIEQIVIETTDRGKQDALIKYMQEDPPFLGIIFCRTKRRAAALNEALIDQGFMADELHGDLSQAKREAVLKKFREAKLQFLVATDIAARGLDIEGITHVYNYDVPPDAEGYIHRIGRTGRAGQRGVAVTFATPHDRQELIKIEKGTDGKLRKIGGARQNVNSRDMDRADISDSGRGSARSGGRGSARDGGRGRSNAGRNSNASAGRGGKGAGAGKRGGFGGATGGRAGAGERGGFGRSEGAGSARGGDRAKSGGFAGRSGSERDERGSFASAGGGRGRGEQREGQGGYVGRQNERAARSGLGGPSGRAEGAGGARGERSGGGPSSGFGSAKAREGARTAGSERSQGGGSYAAARGGKGGGASFGGAKGKGGFAGRSGGGKPGAGPRGGSSGGRGGKGGRGR